MLRYFCIAFLSLLFISPLVAQSRRDLAEVERELAALAREVLMGDSLNHKIQRNKEFATLLMQTLRRPESYNYRWDSLVTLSVLRPDDDAFRLFTWHIVDRNRAERRGEQYHYYFGVVQRRYEDEAGREKIAVIPLLETNNIRAEYEHMVMNDQSWLGAQYYLPQHRNRIPSYTLKTRPPEVENAYVIGGRSLESKKIKYYLLMGWNGSDNAFNYKVLDVMHFDPDNPERVLFGLPVFFFARAGNTSDNMFVTKHRMLFKYSENAPFSLNMSYVRLNPLRRREMIVYDHLAEAEGRLAKTALWEVGPDGSQDALGFVPRKGGYFRLYRDVRLAEKYNRRLSRNQRRVYEIYHDDKTQARIRKKELEEMAREERERLKEAGVLDN